MKILCLLILGFIAQARADDFVPTKCTTQGIKRGSENSLNKVCIGYLKENEFHFKSIQLTYESFITLLSFPIPKTLDEHSSFTWKGQAPYRQRPSEHKDVLLKLFYKGALAVDENLESIVATDPQGKLFEADF